MVYDFNDYPLSGIYYGGSERKLGLLIYEEKYMLKFQKKTPFGKRNNHISEYLGSHIFEELGIPCHKTFLGMYYGNSVVACKDFVIHGFQFVPFNDIGESSIDSEKENHPYSYSDIVYLLEKNKKITKVEETVSMFFDMYIIDALIGNFDRHGGNWGFLKKNNCYSLAPIFDNGSCLFPNLVHEDEMRYILDNPDEIDRRVYTFPTSQILLDGKKSSYFDVISSLKYSLCNEALVRIYNRINMNHIYKLVDSLPISEVHKEFYKTMLKARYEGIIKYSYRKLMEKNNE